MLATFVVSTSAQVVHVEHDNIDVAIAGIGHGDTSINHHNRKEIHASLDD